MSSSIGLTRKPNTFWNLVDLDKLFPIDSFALLFHYTT
uniref:Uncharacterized protein n=1 Tax=Rhizophora mucronata TaxID=61149 RepID=A0A2P2QE13_RHIMU